MDHQIYIYKPIGENHDRGDISSRYIKLIIICIVIANSYVLTSIDENKKFIFSQEYYVLSLGSWEKL